MSKEITLTERQKSILAYISESEGAGNKDIREFLRNSGEDVERVTVVRDLDALLSAGLIRKLGAGRGVSYQTTAKIPALSYIDPDSYFTLGPDERTVRYPSFNFSVFGMLRDIFDEEERKKYEDLNRKYLEKYHAASPVSLRKEFERLTIELSWKSSRIEGNTYSLIDTEILIKEKKEASGHKKEEAIMILNHKSAFDFILSKPERFREISIADIEAIHSLLVKDLGVETGLRKGLVGIAGTAYRPLDNVHQIREAMEKTSEVINKEPFPVAKALLAAMLIAYIQPFEDGNKRTSRLLANAILLAHGYCPLSFRSIDEAEYKKAVVLFYEQNNLRYFMELFLEQFRFSVENAFGGGE